MLYHSMKQIITILIFLMSTNIAQAQFAENNAIYFSSDLNLGNYIGVDFHLNYVLKEKYSFRAGFTGNIGIKPKSRPDDYNSGFAGVLFFGLINPYDLIETYEVGFGKIYNLNKSGTIRVNLSIGVGLTTIREPENWQIVGADASWSSPNYTWNYKKYNTVSLIINPKIEFPV